MSYSFIVGIAVIAAVLFMVATLYREAREAYLRRWLPPLTVEAQSISYLTREVLREMCVKANNPGHAVRMGEYFVSRGWNRADVLEILSEPLKHGLVKKRGWRYDAYAPTHSVWKMYRETFMQEMSAGNVHVWASGGSFVAGININSSGSSAQTGDLNRTDTQAIATHQLISALRQDADTAQGAEAQAARNHADDLEEAVVAQDPARLDVVLNRVNSLIAAASTGFSLTRALLHPGA